LDERGDPKIKNDRLKVFPQTLMVNRIEATLIRSETRPVVELNALNALGTADPQALAAGEWTLT
jgi:hypothetical protein